MKLKRNSAFATALAALMAGSAMAQDAPAPEKPAVPAAAPVKADEDTNVTPEQAAQILLDALPQQPAEKKLRFNFKGTPWNEVLSWLSEEADLSLQINTPPTGTVTFSDPTREYSVGESLDLLNRLLLDRGFALVRRGRMLLLVDLEVENVNKLISEIAELVSPKELDKRGRSDIVSCVFSLGSLTPDEAREQLPQLVGPAGRVVVIDGPRQVKITETVDKLMAIRSMLEAAKSEVVELKLEHRGADEVLEAARPLLDLEPGENTSDEIKISVNLFGDRMYATGLPSKISILESLVEKLDKPLEVADDSETDVAAPELKTHPVENADATSVFDVLQTLLQDQPDTRISIEPNSQAIIAMARPKVQERIAKVIAQMDGNGRELKVLTLRRLDPAQAILTIQKYFGVGEDAEGNAIGSGPIIDADPATGKLWVRGTKKEIEKIEELVGELEGQDALGDLGDHVRILPYSGNSAVDALDQVEAVWKAIGRKNIIERYPSRPDGEGTRRGGGMRERKLFRDADQPSEAETAPATDIDASYSPARTKYRFVTTPVQQEPSVDATADDPKKFQSIPGAAIIVQATPAGLMIASDDTEALDAFQALLEQFATPDSATDDLPEIFWLKYAKAADAAELISNVLGGSDSTLSSLTDTVTSGLGGGLGGMMGMMMGGGGGGGSTQSPAKTILTTTGSVSLVSDTRLNALFVQANATDMLVIQKILEKYDRPDSPEDVQVNGRPYLIPVIYQEASEIANIVKSAFGERIAGQQSSSAGRGGGQPSPQDFINAIRGGRGGGSQAKTSEHPKINISVDERSNSIIVFATPSDYEQVRLLVEQLDEGGKQVEEVVITLPIPGNVNGDAMIGAISAVLGRDVTKSSEGTATTTANGENRTGGASSDEIQRRIEAFRALRGGAGGGQTGRGGFGGGSPFGGGRGGATGGPGGGRGAGGARGGGGGRGGR